MNRAGFFLHQKLFRTSSRSKKRMRGEKSNVGDVRESNPGPLAPKARIIPLDQHPLSVRRTKKHEYILHVQSCRRERESRREYSRLHWRAKVGTDTSTVQVLLKILYFSGMISHWIWYTENYWLAHNFPHICPSRPLCWLLSLCPTTFRLTLSNKAEEYDDNSRSFSPKSHADSWIRRKCPDQNYQ